MRRELWMVALLVPLGGCYVPNQGYGYAQPGYPPPGYPPPGYAAPGYPNGYATDPYASAYPGYSYNGGSPVYIDGGVTLPLILFGGEWGYYDRDQHFHRAPEGVARDLQARRAGGSGQFHPQPGPEGRPAQAGEPRGGPAGFRPREQPRPNAAAAPASTAPRPAQSAPQPRREERERGRECPQGQRC